MARMTWWRARAALVAIMVVVLAGCEGDAKIDPRIKSAAGKVAKSLAQKNQPSRQQPAGRQQPGDSFVGARSAPGKTSGGAVGIAGETIRIASFNIQVLGQSKLKKPGVADSLVDIIRRFDIVAVQELRSKEQNVIPALVQMLNANGGQFDSLVGPRQGRTNSKEQYVFLFNTRTIEYIPDSAFLVPDPQDLLHREPMAASFRARPRSGRGFSFTLLNIHTDPDDTDVELDALDDSFRFVQSRVRPEDDVILLGDLNVDAAHLGELGRLPSMTWTVRGEMTNTLRTKSYDNILFHRHNTAEFTGRSGVFDMERELQIDRRTAVKISDHQPVWAEFRAAEAPVAVAGRPRERRK